MHSAIVRISRERLSGYVDTLSIMMASQRMMLSLTERTIIVLSLFNSEVRLYSLIKSLRL